MYSGELEVQAKRKALAVLQDEINRILNSVRDLSTLPALIIKADKSEIKQVLERIKNTEDEVEALRRKITREIADVGGLMMNRENLLNTAYTMDEIAGYITGIAFKLSNIKAVTLKKEKIEKDLSELIELAVDQIYKLNEIVRALGGNSTVAIDLAHEAQRIEKSVDEKYRELTIRVLEEVTTTKELMLLKDVVEGIEEMSDRCLEVSDSFILLALSL
ncbi:MAG: phosphate transport regulator [Thaumarchaeota archaeon 13_1_20CM_2_39_11]|nr:MAG: phosphate transport regulator [Thaumarchaeota archaeon 13_1_40CM_2_39_13_1]OLE44112.1 MAG: phosphate transport regulator [Thaumarchaeota archaeon 13_1_20CM_2_39_11]